MFGGSWPFAALIAARTSAAAPSMLRLSSNCTLMTLSPRVDDEVIWATPGIWPNCSSSGLATVAAMVCGSAPGNCAVTLIVG
jgi:hypothetical protein